MAISITADFWSIFGRFFSVWYQCNLYQPKTSLSPTMQKNAIWRPSWNPIVLLSTDVYELLKKLATQSYLEILIWGREGIKLKLKIKSAKLWFLSLSSNSTNDHIFLNLSRFFGKKIWPSSHGAYLGNDVLSFPLRSEITWCEYCMRTPAKLWLFSFCYIILQKKCSRHL